MSDEERPDDEDDEKGDGYLFGPDGEGWKESDKPSEEGSDEQPDESLGNNGDEADESEDNRNMMVPVINPMMLLMQLELLSWHNQQLQKMLALQNQAIAAGMKQVETSLTEFENFRKHLPIFLIMIAVTSFLMGGLAVLFFML